MKIIKIKRCIELMTDINKSNKDDIKTISKEHLYDWLEQLAKAQKIAIYGPVSRGDYSEFARLRKISDLDLSIRNTTLSAKGVLLPQTKSLLKFDLKKDAPEIESALGAEPGNVGDADKNNIQQKMVLGIRPCDVHGIMALDPTFDSEFKDPYYLFERKRTILVGLACNEPDVNCFCTSLGSGPHDGSGMDILLTDIGSSYMVNIYTETGKKLIKSGPEPKPELFETPTDEQYRSRDNAQRDAENRFLRKMATGGKPELLAERFESDYWEDIARKCLGCGICTYICPTCYCFDITDEKWGTKGERVFTWDSCMYPEYTVHASGHNPRPARKHRLRNRVYHKFKYYPELHNIFGCTGCGRCIRSCPVNIDIIDIINGIK